MLAVRLRLGMVAMALVLGIASFALNVAMIGPDPVAAFYLPFTRAFELLAGAVLFRGWSWIDQGNATSNRRAGPAWRWCGIRGDPRSVPRLSGLVGAAAVCGHGAPFVASGLAVSRRARGPPHWCGLD